MSDSLTERFDEQFVLNTHKDTLREPLYHRFITESAAEDEIDDLYQINLIRSFLIKSAV